MFTDELTRYQEQHLLVEVYTTPQNTSKFSVGYILAFDDSFFIMLTVNRYGRLNGFALKKTDDIIRLCENSVYLKKIANLMRYYNAKQESFPIGGDLVFSLLDYCKENNRIASIEVVDSDSVDTRGYIEDVDGDKCTVMQVSDNGHSDGVTYLLMKDVTHISCCSDEEVMYEILNSELLDERHSG